MRKPRGTLTILAEYHRKVPAALRANGVEEYEIPEITFVSSEVRNSGASVLALNMDKQSGGATLDDFAVALKEQQTAKGNFPGPLPLVWADVVVDEVQLAQAYVAGAHGVTLTLDALGAERCKKLRDDAEQLYGLESVVVVAPALDGDLEGMIKTALEEINATMLMVAGVDADLAIAAKAWIPKTVTAIARINARGGKGLDEAEDAWRLRDAGYDAVWVSDVLYKFGGAPDSITSVIKAMKSKASVKYARASGAFSGRGEGSKEYLGDILM
ncbi:hypothetical protein M885DRAFT_449292 [Pelagophyceae sp. CCMP2097]|nr:hypothetical protein M885DRAFT_449292 [Pelagophyceae sp. CCMP2097]